MQLRKTIEQVYVFRLETALFSVFDLVELEIRDRVIEIGVGVIQRIEIQDVTSDDRLIQRIEIQDVTSKFKDLGPIFCLVGHKRERQIRRHELCIDSGGLGIRFA